MVPAVITKQVSNDLAVSFPETRFHWLDIEECADDLGDLDVENFPTLFIQRQNLVLLRDDVATRKPLASHDRNVQGADDRAKPGSMR